MFTLLSLLRNCVRDVCSSSPSPFLRPCFYFMLIICIKNYITFYYSILWCIYDSSLSIVLTVLINCTLKTGIKWMIPYRLPLDVNESVSALGVWLAIDQVAVLHTIAIKNFLFSLKLAEFVNYFLLF